MEDLISRQAAIDKLEPWLKVREYSEGELNMLKAVIYELRELPPAEPERKKGKWIPSEEIARELLAGNILHIEYANWNCSQCGANVSEMQTIRFKFCPNCGAELEDE